MVTALVIDTDIGSDVDDAIALALAVRHPDIDLCAVTTVSSQPGLRAQFAARLLQLAGADVERPRRSTSDEAPPAAPTRRADVEVAAGHSVAGDDRNVIGAEHTALLSTVGSAVSDRDASAVLAGVRSGTAIATIGQQTNLAAAVAQDPSLPSRASALTVMGGSFRTFRTPDGGVHGPERDWNLVLDPVGAVSSLSAGWQVRYVPIDVTFGAVLTCAQVDRLRGGDELCRTLAGLVDGWRERSLPPGPHDVAAFLHDPLAVACVADCAFVEVERQPVTVMLDASGLARTLVDELEGHPADVVRAVDARAFADWVVDTLLDG